MPFEDLDRRISFVGAVQPASRSLHRFVEGFDLGEFAVVRSLGFNPEVLEQVSRFGLGWPWFFSDQLQHFTGFASDVTKLSFLGLLIERVHPGDARFGDGQLQIEPLRTILFAQVPHAQLFFTASNSGLIFFRRWRTVQSHYPSDGLNTPGSKNPWLVVFGDAVVRFAGRVDLSEQSLDLSAIQQAQVLGTRLFGAFFCNLIKLLSRFL